jgi:hypothetical protein
MTEVDITELQRAVERLHKCKAIFRECVGVKEQFRGELVWEGIVHIFDLIGHPMSKTCYAWSSPIKGITKRRFYAVLSIPPVITPSDAIRASIIQDSRLDR